MKTMKVLLVWGLAILCEVSTANAATVLLGPSPYLSFADSSFNGETFSYFHLETFEDGLFNTPGVTKSAGNVISRLTSSFVDSVDVDDGVIDGSGMQGHSLYSASGATGISFTFNAGTLGSLPTDVGIVWTDGAGTTRFEAFDASNVSIGVIGPVSIADALFNGATAEDRFFGVSDPNGISRLLISNTSGGIEVDHLQYGLRAIPIPAAMWFFGSGLIVLFGRFRNSKKRSGLTPRSTDPRPQGRLVFQVSLLSAYRLAFSSIQNNYCTVSPAA